MESTAAAIYATQVYREKKMHLGRVFRKIFSNFVGKKKKRNTAKLFYKFYKFVSKNVEFKFAGIFQLNPFLLNLNHYRTSCYLYVIIL